MRKRGGGSGEAGRTKHGRHTAVVVVGGRQTAAAKPRAESEESPRAAEVGAVKR